MPVIRRILVPVKELDAKVHPTAIKAAQLARACNAELQLFHILPTPALPQWQLQEVRRLQTMADQLRAHGVTVTVAAEWDHPVHEAIVRRAVATKADLIVVSKLERQHRSAWLLPLTHWDLLRLSPVPVLQVKNPQAYRHPAILLAVDSTNAFAQPLQLDQEILRMGRAVSAGLEGTLHVVQANSGTPVTLEVMPLSTSGNIERQTERATKASPASVLRAMPIAASRRHLIASDPVEAITAAAKKSQSAIVVIGAVPRPGLKGLTIGNTAERILDEISCDVLVMKPPKSRNRVAGTTRGGRAVMNPFADAIGYY